MSSLAQQMQNKGFNVKPSAPAPMPVEEENTLPGPIELRDGIMFDSEVAQQEPKEDYFFGLFEGPSTKAFTSVPDERTFLEKLTLQPNTAADKLRAQTAQKFEQARVDRLQPEAQKFGVSIAPYGEEVSELIQEKAGASGQSQLYLADNDEQYLNAMENVFGEGNVRMIKDDGPNLSLFAPRNYVSIRREDGTFTDFSPASTSFTDYAKRYAPGLLAEGSAALAIVPTAFATSAAVSLAFPAVAPVLGPFTFLYTLYSGGKGVEAGRQYLQDVLDLNDEEALKFSGTLDAIYKMAVPQIEGITTDKRTKAETQREIAAILELGFAAIPALGDKMAIAISRAREKGALSKSLFEPAIRATETVEKTLPGGAMDIGVPLEDLMLQQLTPNKLINRISSLTEQTSLIIPLRIKEQMESVVKYLREYGNKVGEGDFEVVRRATASVGDGLAALKGAAKDDAIIRDLSTIGENINTLDAVFLRLRAIEARGLYNKVFDKVKNSKYNLDELRTKLPEGTRTIIPTTPADATVKSKDTMTGAVPPPKRGERIVDDLISDLMMLGKVQKDGSRVLNPQQIGPAIKDFQSKNPGFEFDPKNIDSPAKILQLYATRFGELARDTFSKAGSAPDGAQFKQAMDLRNTLLDLIGNPIDAVDGVADDLLTANNFYKETFDLTSTEIQVQARNARLGTIKGEPAVLPEAVGTTPGATGRTAPATITMENINAQEQYVRNFLANETNVENMTADALAKATTASGAAQQLKDNFANVLASKLKRTVGTDLADKPGAEELVRFLDSFEPRQLRALGIDEVQEESLRSGATVIANLQRGGAMEQILAAPRKSTIAEQFETILSGDTATTRAGLNELLAIGRRQGTAEAQKQYKEELRSGLLNHIISRESGVLETVTSQSAYADVGQDIINVKAFQDIIQKLNRTNVFEDILTSDDKAVLDAMVEYAGVINRKGADAGSALAGAQIIGEMFTVDPGKFVSGLARLGTQSRIARIFANKEFVKAATGTGKPMSKAEKLKKMFFGKGALGSIIAKVALERDFRESDEDQTNRMLLDSSNSALGRRLQRFGGQP